MYIYEIECKENGFKYECKSFQKICDMFSLKYNSTYNSLRNTEYNHQGYYTPKGKKGVTIKRIRK